MDDSLGNELKKVRKGKQMTLQSLSDKSGLSISFLSQVKREIRTLMFTSLKKISGALEVNINFFFNDGDTSIKKSVKKTKKQFRSFLIHQPGRSDEAS